MLAVAVGDLALVGALRAAPLHTQTFTLQPGWNSLWLEVQPANNDASAVFAGLPLESAWTFQARLSAVQFIEDPNEAVWNRSSWRMYLPTNRLDSFQNNLFAVHANRPYLLNVTNTSPILWSVTGVPSVRSLEWVPDSYNLRGFPIDPARPPTFANFFRPAPAHYDAATGQLRKIYRLNASGQWALVSGGDTMQRGIAYWVFAHGNSEFTAPLGFTLAQGDGLNYGASLTELPLDFHNLSTSNKTIAVRDLCPPSVLSYRRFSTNNSDTWPALPVPHTLALPGSGEAQLRLAVRRQDFTNQQHACLLEVSDGQGTLYRVAVTAQIPASVFAGNPVTPQQRAQSHAGLWVGTVTLNGVAEVNAGNLVTNPVTGGITRVGVSTNPTPTRSEVNLRLLLHVDTNGVTRLLREVIQMWADGAYTNDPSGFLRTATPGRFVLLTDDTLLPNYRGAALRDGQPVGRRLSTVGFDFDAGGATTLPLTGNFGVPNRLTGALTLAPTSPTNPFRHKYHPDHDNLDATFRNFVAEAYEVTRNIELTFTASDPTGSASPDYGYGVLGGTYRERVSGLHKDALHVAGTFRLSRVAVTGVLNQ
jgi:hypothetical protein